VIRQLLELCEAIVVVLEQYSRNNAQHLSNKQFIPLFPLKGEVTSPSTGL
jgi:hypothetical protein